MFWPARWIVRPRGFSWISYTPSSLHGLDKSFNECGRPLQSQSWCIVPRAGCQSRGQGPWHKPGPGLGLSRPSPAPGTRPGQAPRPGPQARPPGQPRPGQARPSLARPGRPVQALRGICCHARWCHICLSSQLVRLWKSTLHRQKKPRRDARHSSRGQRTRGRGLRAGGLGSATECRLRMLTLTDNQVPGL